MSETPRPLYVTLHITPNLHPPGGGGNARPYFFPISITRGMSCCCCGLSAPISSKNPSKPDSVMTHIRRPGVLPTVPTSSMSLASKVSYPKKVKYLQPQPEGQPNHCPRKRKNIAGGRNELVCEPNASGRS